MVSLSESITGEKLQIVLVLKLRKHYNKNHLVVIWFLLLLDLPLDIQLVLRAVFMKIRYNESMDIFLKVEKGPFLMLFMQETWQHSSYILILEKYLSKKLLDFNAET